MSPPGLLMLKKWYDTSRKSKPCRHQRTMMQFANASGSAHQDYQRPRVQPNRESQLNSKAKADPCRENQEAPTLTATLADANYRGSSETWL